LNGIISSRVLIVEDDEAIAALIQRTLAEASLHSDLAHNGRDGLWMARDETDAFELGADDYLRRPFSPGVLTARVRSLLRRGATIVEQICGQRPAPV